MFLSKYLQMKHDALAANVFMNFFSLSQVWVIWLNKAIMEFTFTERGARKLIRNGYQYVKQKNLANGLTWWECIQRRNCKAKVKLNTIDDFVEQVQEHFHTPSATRCELTKVRASIKRKASTTHDTTQQIFGTELASLTPTAALNLRNVFFSNILFKKL